MWISRKAWDATMEGFRQREQELQAREAQALDRLARTEQDLKHARTELVQVERQLRAEITGMVGDTRAAQTRADLLTIDVNMLREERAILLDKALTAVGGFKPQVPHMGPARRTAEPGVSFEDMGDEHAAATGLTPDPDPWPQEWDGPRRPDPSDEQTDVTLGADDDPGGAPGTVYNPAAPTSAGY